MLPNHKKGIFSIEKSILGLLIKFKFYIRDKLIFFDLSATNSNVTL